MAASRKTSTAPSPRRSARVELGTWDVPPIISYVVEKAGLSEEEALKTFNMGVGMCVICKPEDAAAMRAELESTGETVFTIGSIVKGAGNVTYA